LKQIHESGEDYLETILKLQHSIGSVRSIDIAEEKQYSKSSVSRAVNLLKKNGFITIDETGVIDFTKKGRQTVTSIYARHELLTKFLVTIGVEKNIAESDSCRMEHVISEATFLALKKHLENL
jgi:Mn-dependent DtxR family transcriptional regulator